MRSRDQAAELQSISVRENVTAIRCVDVKRGKPTTQRDLIRIHTGAGVGWLSCGGKCWRLSGTELCHHTGGKLVMILLG